MADPVVPLDPNDTPPLATLGARFFGAIVDGLVQIGIVLLLVGVLLAIGGWEMFERINELALTLILVAPSFVIYIAINWKFLKTSGQTIGKKVAKTRIVTMSGHLPSINDLVFKRYAFMTAISLVPIVGDVASLVNILFIFRSDRRCIHDLVAGTQVVKVLPAQGARNPSPA